MGSLHDELQRALDDIPRQILSQLIDDKLSEEGITLSKSQKQRLAALILDGTADTITFRDWQWWDQETVTLEFTDKDIDRLGKDVDHFIENKLSDIIKSLSADLASNILPGLKKRWPREARKQKREIKSFRKQLLHRWEAPLALLKMFVTIAREFSGAINRDLGDQQSDDAPNLPDVLARLHARGCQVTEEIICLLEAGLADGAMARWRTLHEIAAVALLIDLHGEELAERYVLHQAVESHRAASQFQKFHERLGQEPLEPSEIKEIELSYAEVIAKFGTEFGSPYGWAAHHLDIRRPNFADLEAASQIDHWRPYYKMASYNVHANPKGVFFKLGLLFESDLLLAGPSSAGLADPGQNAAISLMQISSVLGGLHLNLDNLVTIQLMGNLANEIGPAFIEAGAQLKCDAEEVGFSAEEY